MDLLERARMLEELDGELAATAAGGRVVLVAGEAGIGKSALVRRFTERHAAGTRVLVGACDPLLPPRRPGQAGPGRGFPRGARGRPPGVGRGLRPAAHPPAPWAAARHRPPDGRPP